MASSIALLRRATASNLLNKFILPIRSVSVAPSSFRSLNNTAEIRDYDDEERDMVEHRRSDSVAHRRGFAPNLFLDVFDPFAPPRSLSQILNVIDRFGKNPFVVSGSRGKEGASLRRGWNAMEDEDALYLKIDMPGLGKEQVKVSVEENTLVIKGEGEKEDDDEESVRRYSSRIDLPSKLFKIGEIKAEMKNGVLRVLVPKVKEDERKNVHEVNVE